MTNINYPQVDDNKHLIEKILQKSQRSIKKFLHINEKTLANFTIKKISSGFNYSIYFVNFYNSRNSCQKSICVKYSDDAKKIPGLILEFDILKLINLNQKNICPQIVDSNTLDELGITYIIIETIRGNPVNYRKVNTKISREILNLIQLHEKILSENRQYIKKPSIDENINKKIDYEKKMHLLLLGYSEYFTVKKPLKFLNYYLNNSQIIKHRKIVTDRSAENFVIGVDNNIKLIDFSTIRIGTEFDNWIQFIDDPRIKFSCTKSNLINMFFNKNKKENNINYYYAASIYTNMLQGIFTFNRNPSLGKAYFNNVNSAYFKLKKTHERLIVGI